MNNSRSNIPDSPPGHEPVLPRETIRYLEPETGKKILDCTVGGGGHARLIIERLLPDGILIGIDADEQMVGEAARHLSEFRGNVKLCRGNFGDLRMLLSKVGVQQVDGALFDLGVSSQQLAWEGRGFSFLRNDVLDMRFDRSGGRTAADIINSASEQELARIIRRYGEEPAAGRIARAIVRRRERGRIETTGQLVDAVLDAAGRRKRHLHPATLTFMALRLAVNEELEQLERGLAAAAEVLGPGGRLVVISFHSLEDRIVKRFLADRSAGGDFRILTRKVVTPTEEERRRNVRSRSAKLRAAEKL